jgi:hypothetical protein
VRGRAETARGPSVQPSVHTASTDARGDDPDPAAIGLPRLPAQGIAVERGAGVVLVDLRGREVAWLDGFHLDYEWTVPGAVILRNRRRIYTLNVTEGSVTPVAGSPAGWDPPPQFQEGVDPSTGATLDLELPNGATRSGGFWAYALPSPDGSALLGQWSGECEVPVAFFLDADGTDPVAVFGGGGLRGAAESRGLGWTHGGRAVVQLMVGRCGPGGPPGVYLVEPEGAPSLLVRVPEDSAARAWGTA